MMNPRSQRGAALVEFALILPILVLLVFGIIDYGRFASVKINLNEAAQEGAIYGSTHPEFADHADIRTRVVQSVDNPTLTTADVTITCPTDRTLRVEVSHTAGFLTPVIPGSLTLTSDVITDVLTPSADCTTS